MRMSLIIIPTANLASKTEARSFVIIILRAPHKNDNEMSRDSRWCRILGDSYEMPRHTMWYSLFLCFHLSGWYLWAENVHLVRSSCWFLFFFWRLLVYDDSWRLNWWALIYISISNTNKKNVVILGTGICVYFNIYSGLWTDCLSLATCLRRN